MIGKGLFPPAGHIGCVPSSVLSELWSADKFVSREMAPGYTEDIGYPFRVHTMGLSAAHQGLPQAMDPLKDPPALPLDGVVVPSSESMKWACTSTLGVKPPSRRSRLWTETER